MYTYLLYFHLYPLTTTPHPQVYWAGPISGGILAALLYTYVFRAPKAASYDLEMDNYGKRNTQP
ncbi:hypothetical protein E2C01_101150 [Portunus trituberculatus]|uniref:Uncharacterized protein n=1 Tax=Portunus trituberculatus TaxID=210409 RepID=A0A5B7KE10_PORTR|nr:hypothetical protein [Portunus trituberculatus]